MSKAIETQLATLGFHLVPPSRALRPYIQSYWYFRPDTPLLAYREEYMHPRGGYGLVFNFGDQVTLDHQLLNEPFFLDGTTTVSRTMGFFGHVNLLGIRFHEGGAYPILSIPLAELRNQTCLLDLPGRASLLQLYAQLYEAVSIPAQINLLETWLVQRLSLGKQRSDLVPASLSLLRASAGALPMTHVAQQFAISQRQLERLYQVQVGMSPKQYSQLLRVEAARLALKRWQAHSISPLAVDLGFYDQSHFIREFSAVTGMTPHAYLKRSTSKQ